MSENDKPMTVKQFAESIGCDAALGALSVDNTKTLRKAIRDQWKAQKADEEAGAVILKISAKLQAIAKAAAEDDKSF